MERGFFTGIISKRLTPSDSQDWITKQQKDYGEWENQWKTVEAKKPRRRSELYQYMEDVAIKGGVKVTGLDFERIRHSVAAFSAKD